MDCSIDAEKNLIKFIYFFFDFEKEKKFFSELGIEWNCFNWLADMYCKLTADILFKIKKLLLSYKSRTVLSSEK